MADMKESKSVYSEQVPDGDLTEYAMARGVVLEFGICSVPSTYMYTPLDFGQPFKLKVGQFYLVA